VKEKKEERNFSRKTEYLQPLLHVGGGIIITFTWKDTIGIFKCILVSTAQRHWTTQPRANIPGKSSMYSQCHNATHHISQQQHNMHIMYGVLIKVGRQHNSER